MEITSMKRIPLRELWEDEARNFTPWLAEHIHLLGDALDIQIEVRHQEKRVGIFRADIEAVDQTTGKSVLIENQLDRTDHVHLGQLLTYASNLHASTVIWVADHFQHEHKRVLHWLNENVRKTRFFGVEVEVWQIERSAPAVKFTIACHPNKNYRNEPDKRLPANTTESSGTRTRRIDPAMVDALVHPLLEKDGTLTHRKIVAMDIVPYTETIVYTSVKRWRQKRSATQTDAS